MRSPNVEEVVLRSKRMTRFIARLAAVLVGMALVTFALPSRADDDAVDRAAEQLKNGDDFRVRTQAALSLGASKIAARGRAPVRRARGFEHHGACGVGRGLGKLKRGGEDCLTKRLDDETSDIGQGVDQEGARAAQGRRSRHNRQHQGTTSSWRR